MTGQRFDPLNVSSSEVGRMRFLSKVDSSPSERVSIPVKREIAISSAMRLNSFNFTSNEVAGLRFLQEVDLIPSEDIQFLSVKRKTATSLAEHCRSESHFEKTMSDRGEAHAGRGVMMESCATALAGIFRPTPFPLWLST